VIGIASGTNSRTFSKWKSRSAFRMNQEKPMRDGVR